MNPDTGTSPSRAAATGGSIDICSDILTEILILLPAKTLTRLKLVSKHWFSLISSDEFYRRRRRRRTLLFQSHPSKFFKIRPFDKTPILSPLPITFPNPKILSHCSGLMLLESDSCYFVYNPTTTQSRRILVDYSKDYKSIKGFTLAFDPSKSTRYSIILVRSALKPKGWFRKLFGLSSDSNPSYRIEVYDSVSRVWKIGSEPFDVSPEPSLFSSFRGVHCNNVIYWNISGRIWCYDIGNGIVSTLLTNPGYDGSEIQESNGNIFIINRIRDWMEDSLHKVELWEFQGNGDWLLKYKFRFHYRFAIRFNDEMECLVFRRNGKIMVYSFVDDKEKEVGDSWDYYNFFLYLYEETLTLV